MNSELTPVNAFQAREFARLGVTHRDPLFVTMAVRYKCLSTSNTSIACDKCPASLSAAREVRIMRLCFLLRGSLKFELLVASMRMFRCAPYRSSGTPSQVMLSLEAFATEAEVAAACDSLGCPSAERARVRWLTDGMAQEEVRHAKQYARRSVYFFFFLGEVGDVAGVPTPGHSVVVAPLRSNVISVRPWPWYSISTYRTVLEVTLK